MADIMKRVRPGPPDGHPRYGGRMKGSLNRKTVAIKDLAEKLGTDPVETLLNIVRNDCLEVPIFDPATGNPLVGDDGKPAFKWQAITTRMRLDACKELMPYIAPKLASTQVTGKDEGPVQVATLDITQILADPELARGEQRMALKLADQRADADAEANTTALLKRVG